MHYCLLTSPYRHLTACCLPHTPTPPTLQVPLNSTSCEVESPWGNQGTVKLGEEICEILNRGIRDYVTNRLFAIWGVGSPIDPPA